MANAKQMSAKFPGFCRVCRQDFPAGTNIFWSKGEGSRHVTCPAKSEAAAGDGPAPAAEAAPLVLSYDGGRHRPTRDGHIGEVRRLGRHAGDLAGKVVTVVRQRSAWIREDGDSLGLNPGHDSGWLVTLWCREATAEEVAKLEAEEAEARRVEEERAAKVAAAKAAKEAAAEAYRMLREQRTAGLVDAGETFDLAVVGEKRLLATHDDFWRCSLYEVTLKSGAVGIYETSYSHDDSRSRLWASQADVEAAWRAWQERVGVTPADARKWLEHYSQCSGNEFYRWVAAQQEEAA